MPMFSPGRLMLAALAAWPLAACVAGPSNPVSARATELANTVSRAGACRAGAPRADTLSRFLAVEKARGASDDQIASARSAYVGVSEADTVNQGIRPQACAAEERDALRRRMAEIRAGNFEAR